MRAILTDDLEREVITSLRVNLDTHRTTGEGWIYRLMQNTRHTFEFRYAILIDTPDLNAAIDRILMQDNSKVGLTV